MSLTPEQRAAREGKLTASRVGVLMNGGDEALYDLWRELTGDPSHVPADLSDVWAVQLGTVTEELNLDWYQRRTGREVTRRGEVVISRERPWASCTLDGWDGAYPSERGQAGPGMARRGTAGRGEARQGMEPAVIEAKHVSGFEPLETIVARYTPQLMWQQYVTGSRLAVLSIIQGAREPVIEDVPLDDDYLAELLRRADEFWRCVVSLTPPVAPPPVAPPLPAAARTIDMSGSNAWAAHASAWIEHRDGAVAFRTAEKEIKALVPEDASRAHGHGVEVKRARNGALRIGEMKDG